MYTKEMKLVYKRDVHTPLISETPHTIAKKWKTSKCPSTD
jgi:hypothetical protein